MLYILTNVIKILWGQEIITLVPLGIKINTYSPQTEMFSSFQVCRIGVRPVRRYQRYEEKNKTNH